MMLYPAMNKLTSYIPNRYMLVNVVAHGKLDASHMDLTIEEPEDMEA